MANKCQSVCECLQWKYSASRYLLVKTLPAVSLLTSVSTVSVTEQEEASKSPELREASERLLVV